MRYFKPVTVNMSEVFANAGLKMTSATAWSLTGNQKIEIWMQRNLIGI